MWVRFPVCQLVNLCEKNTTYGLKPIKWDREDTRLCGCGWERQRASESVLRLYLPLIRFTVELVCKRFYLNFSFNLCHRIFSSHIFSSVYKFIYGMQTNAKTPSEYMRFAAHATSSSLIFKPLYSLTPDFWLAT